MKSVHARDAVVATIMTELSRNKVFDKRVRTNLDFVTRWFYTLGMSFAHAEGPATFVSI